MADLPLDMWASAYSVVDDRLVVVGGAAVDSSMVTNEGFAYDAVIRLLVGAAAVQLRRSCGRPAPAAS